MVMIPARFQHVRWDTFRENACSPVLRGSFRGLCLAAPERVTLSDDGPLPVAGAYRVSGRFLNRFKSMANEIVVVAVDAATHEPRSANLLGDDEEAEPSGLDPNDPNLDRVVIGGWFNLDLFHWMRDLPRRAARYHVFATVGDVVSNVVAIEIVA